MIGGGITGLSAAQRLISADPTAEVVIFEASERFGGIIRTEQADGFLMELGPDSFITNKPGGIQLCDDVGFADQLIPTDGEFRRSLVLRNGKPQLVPEGFMLMAPAKPWAIATTPVLSVAGKIRLLREAFVRPKPNPDEDESLADFVRRRFGRQALDRLVQPLVGGIYTSDPEKLSLKATLPRFIEMEQKYGSVIRATLAEQRQKKGRTESDSGSGARYGLFATPRSGLGSLVDRVVALLQESDRVTLRSNLKVSGLSRSPATGGEADPSWQVSLPGVPDEIFDAVILTLPTYKAADLLNDESFADLARALRGIEYASSAVVVTTHRLSDFRHALDAFGLVVPAIENRKVLAVSFTSRKFPGRAPAGHVLLRTFVGGAMQPELLENSDTEITEFVHQELSAMLGMTASPGFSQVVRHQRAMPQYYVGHGAKVAEIERLSAMCRGLHLAGSAYFGVGLPDSIASGRSAADRVQRDT
ncbi:MAG TPA: protoporphyrinogen oxidase [Planctomycetes bacterium]|nr:protoporphyrinogen oxidase [Fuerstiella sp.]HIK94237.1 protoporphyrinogen oxidase [Planctomycetota bacterium]